MADKKRKSSYSDINKKYDFSSGRVSESEMRRRKKNAEKNRREMRKQRNSYNHEQDMGKTIVLTPEMVEMERKRIARQKRIARKKKLRRRRIISAIVAIVLILLIIFAVKKIINKNNAKPKQQTTITNQTPVKPQPVVQSLVKFSKTNKMTNLYEKSEKVSTVLEQIPNNAYVKYYSDQGDFSYVVYNGKKGYILKSDLSDIENKNQFKVIKGVLIVNSDYTLPSDYDPGIDEDARKSFTLMVNDANKDGVILRSVSDYRSFEQQSKLEDVEDVKFVKAGTSEHQTGLAYDLIGEDYTLKYKLDFSKSKEYKWLMDNAYKYGFVLRYPEGKKDTTGLSYAPWHFRYVGIDLAKILHDQNLTLEEYLKVADENVTNTDNNKENSDKQNNEEKEPSNSEDDGQNNNENDKNNDNNDNNN
ncbi:MAG: D-alanyl-D-alanine carboxypeptidase family protein [Finegoldia magna]|uniref:D-alanyl-D-alanine carboxypeptidase family protein n=1 Tax=Finegoldia magna TaxID=1260 RepID=UPI0028FF6597|nr:D-alanyl-D-alanine carboxypeptidase family protein [Finegoldia magna]MDU1010769.1 D-alanyl-D-alanine carboxypeptidase family protein [Finegoldia magna]MDU1087962.1 D-alanyl-D-alanine carboxypeptidase family protein [Finegoldia magna]MDU7889774.1 D-alanyl-D-alanine carboxypeptidase family protein [Finegoldia magna]